jgi:hypothetical protein
MLETPMHPTHVYHADWSTAPNKRWLAHAALGSGGRYSVAAPTLIEDHIDLLPPIRRQIGDGGCALVEFDFPIGIAASYARIAGITAFKPRR